jgi:superfamily I DNA/RNA helicase
MNVEFNADGSLKIPDNVKKELDDLNLDIPSHIKIIRTLDELSFNVGRKLLSEILRGERNSRIKKLDLDDLNNFGCLDLFSSRDIQDLIDKMIIDGFIEIKRLSKNKYMPLIMITPKGVNELKNPLNSKSSNSFSGRFSDCLKCETKITDDDLLVFRELDFFLNKYNDMQKKAIVDSSKKILCIAGAGSGKTTVLTKRIEFLVRFKNVNPKSILAITFTRKAKQEMKERLSRLIPNSNVRVETFNSFCEKQLQKNGGLIYNKEYRVMDYSLKIKAISNCLNEMGISLEDAIEKYFGENKSRRNNDFRHLFFTFVNDMFSLIDHYKYNETEIKKMKDIILKSNKLEEKNLGLFIYDLIQNVIDFKKEYGLRDYTDQIVHTINLFKNNLESIPDFSHILVDEYQDVNDIQVNLIDLLKPDNLFVVGDPRQSIYGWRGSKIQNILNFHKKYDDVSVIQLLTNYRSTKKIVDLGNIIIKNMDLPDLKPNLNDLSDESGFGDDVILINHPDENSEYEFVAQSILSQKNSVKLSDIFILSRTNKQLDLISESLNKYGIDFLKRTIEEKKENLMPNENQVTLSTVHAIKGLEANLVYVVGVNSQMYPCLVSEHPFLNIVKFDDEYDKYSEELRLLYVGLTRAKKKLVISYHNSLSSFITKYVKEKLSFVDCTASKKVNNCVNNYSNDVGFKLNGLQKNDMKLYSELKKWRYETSKKNGIKPYIIFSDRTLDEIIKSKPLDFYELQSINGFGPTKVMKYGDEIIKIIKLFV